MLTSPSAAAYLDQTSSARAALCPSERLSLISPPPPSILISLMGVKLAVGLFLLFWVRVLPTERGSVLLAW